MTDARRRENLRRQAILVPVPKPTQVGEARSLRGSREPSLRNSAKWFRNFGIRIALWLVGLRTEGLGGRSESAQATVYQKHRTVQTPIEEVYSLTPARCQYVKVRGQSFGMKL